MKTVSIIGDAYLQPAVDLLDKTFTTSRLRWRTQIKVISYENGCAAGSCMLAMLCLESYIVRLAYIKKATQNRTRLNALNFFAAQYPTYHGLERIREAFVLRDVLAHNHLWEIETATNRSRDEIIVGAVLHSCSGDKKLQQSLDQRTRRTKRTRIHVIPFQVGREDAVKIHEIVFQALRHMENDDITVCQASHLRVHFRRKYRLWHEVIGEMKSLAKK